MSVLGVVLGMCCTDRWCVTAMRSRIVETVVEPTLYDLMKMMRIELLGGVP